MPPLRRLSAPALPSESLFFYCENSKPRPLGVTVSGGFVDFNRVLRWGYANLFIIGKRADTIRPYTGKACYVDFNRFCYVYKLKPSH